MDQTKPSLDATLKFHDLIQQYLAEFHHKGDSLSVGDIDVGTPEYPRLVVPIEMNPDEIRQNLERTGYILSEAIRWARESARLTKEVMEELYTSSPEAEQRIKSMEKIANRLEEVLKSFRGIAWHPKCYIEIQKIINAIFVPGNPAIHIKVEFLVWV